MNMFQVRQSRSDCEVHILEHVQVILKSSSQRLMNFKKHYGCHWTSVASEPKSNTSDVQVNRNGKSMLYEVRAGCTSQILIRYFTEERVNNMQKYIMPSLILELKYCKSESNKFKLYVMQIATPTQNVLPHWCRIINILVVIYRRKFLFETMFRIMHLSPSSVKKSTLFGQINGAGPKIRTTCLDWAQRRTSSQKITSVVDVQKIYYSVGKLRTSTLRKLVLRGRFVSTEVVRQVLGINYSCSHSSQSRRTCLKEIWFVKYFAQLFVLHASTYIYPGCWMI
jgi:hypothetical protein